MDQLGVAFTYGRAGDLPIVGDWNGDGVDTLGVVRDRFLMRLGHRSRAHRS